MTKALLHELGKSLSYGRLSLFGKVLWPMLLAASDDQGRGLGEGDAIKWYVCPNVPELTQEKIPGVLAEMATQGMITLYQDSRGRKLYQITRWWEYQAMQWAQPSKYDPPDGWTDRLRYRKSGQYIEENWKQDAKKQGKEGEDTGRVSGESTGGDSPETTNQDKPNQDNLSSADAEKTPEEELDSYFGSRGETPKPIEHRHWSERAQNKPWRDWSQGHFREQQGVSVEAQNRVGWLVETITNLKPPGNSYQGWARGCIAVYNAGDGDWSYIEAGIRKAWNREEDYRPTTLACSEETADRNGFVKAVGKALADSKTTPVDPAKAEHARLMQRMENDIQYQTFDKGS